MDTAYFLCWLTLQYIQTQYSKYTSIMHYLKLNINTKVSHKNGTDHQLISNSLESILMYHDLEWKKHNKTQIHFILNGRPSGL